MSNDKRILIVGAGPSGLAMSIFLAELGYEPRVIDKKTEINVHSKALGVNPRTLEILDDYEITKRFLKNGRKMQMINLWAGEKLVFKNNLSKINHRYPFMLIQSQKDSEEILLDEATKRGVKVEYKTELKDLQIKDEESTVQIMNKNPYKVDFLVGADGGNSLVRQKSGIQLEGFRYDRMWEIYDIELTTNIDKDEGHIRLFREGGMIMIRLYENVWRIAGNMENILAFLPKNCATGKVFWKSQFRINHKVATVLAQNNVVLIGDAAHQHSPVGARGMNLGIEDAFLCSKLLHENRLGDYNDLRLRYIRKTVSRINNITQGMAGDSSISKIMRTNLGLLKIIFPLIMPTARKFIMGLNR